MFSGVLESAKQMLFQTTDTYSTFERIKVIYEAFRLSKQDKLCDETN
jgi:hypothetical protein